MIKVLAVGDIMPGGVLSKKGDNFTSKELLDILQSGDVLIGTLEAAIGDAPTFNEEKMSRKGDVIYAPECDLVKLQDFGVNIVSLANNHFFDLGEGGARHTIELLNQMGIYHVGAGNNIEEASEPVLFDVKGERIAILAFCECDEDLIGWCPVATEHTAGINPLKEEYVVSEIAKYKSSSDYVIVLPHWGKEGQTTPTDRQYRLARRMIDAGADLVLGSHTHCIQPVYYYKDKAVAFGMGNFLFPDRLICPPRSTFYPSEPLDLSTLPVTDRYPYVKEVTFKRWRAKARYGLVVEAQLCKKSAIVSKTTTMLSEENHIAIYAGKYPYQAQLGVSGLMLRSGCFEQLYSMQRLMNQTKRMVKTMRSRVFKH